MYFKLTWLRFSGWQLSEGCFDDPLFLRGNSHQFCKFSGCAQHSETVPCCKIVVHVQKPVAAFILILLALEWLPTRISALISPSPRESSFVNFVSHLFAAHWSPTPLRLRMLQLLQFHICSHSPRYRTPGYCFTTTGDAANLPGVFYGTSQTPSMSTHTSQLSLRTGPQPWTLPRHRLRHHHCGLLCVLQVLVQARLAVWKRPWRLWRRGE